MKTIAGAASFAWTNRSRTRAAPMPTIASTNSEADIEKNGTFASPGDRAREQRLAGPGRAAEQHAVGDAAAEPLVPLGLAQEVDDLAQLALGLVDAGDVGEGDAVAGWARSGGRASGRRCRASPARCRPGA